MKKFYLFAFLFSSFSIQSQTYKGMYVDNFDQILGNTQKEDSLFDYMQANNFTALSLYSLHLLDFSSSTTIQKLKNFIQQAKSQHGILDVGACAENAWFFENKILPYNLQATTGERFTVFNLEFEFWTPSTVADYYCTSYLQPLGLSCDETGAFTFYMQELSKIDSICTANNLKSEVYLGWFNQSQIDEIVLKCDRILLHNYNTNPLNTFPYSLTRLQYIGNTNVPIQVAGLFSGEIDFLQNWLVANNNDLDSAFQLYYTDYSNSSGSWKNSIDLIGQHWFTYSVLPYTTEGLGLTQNEMSSFSVYPNPTQGKLYVDSNHKIKNVSVYDVSGKEVLTVENLQNNYLDFSEFEKAIYFIKVDEKMSRFVLE